MSDYTNEIKERLISTIAAQNVLAPVWVWAERTLAELEQDYQELMQKIEAWFDQDADLNGQRGGLDVALEALRQNTVDYLSMARNRFRSDPVKAAVVRTLTAKAKSRADITEQALLWETAWAALDPGWEPRPGATVAAFRAQRLALAPAGEAFAAALIGERLANATLTAAAERIEDHLQAWYADATVLFPADTAKGQVIRAQVPTTYHPRKAKVPPEG